MCWALNHQNIIEMAQRHISLSEALKSLVAEEVALSEREIGLTFSHN
jgi:hypothetical protein